MPLPLLEKEVNPSILSPNAFGSRTRLGGGKPGAGFRMRNGIDPPPHDLRHGCFAVKHGDRLPPADRAEMFAQPRLHSPIRTRLMATL